MSMPPFLRECRHWASRHGAFYEKPTLTARRQLLVLAWWLEGIRSCRKRLVLAEVAT